MEYRLLGFEEALDEFDIGFAELAINRYEIVCYLAFVAKAGNNAGDVRVLQDVAKSDAGKLGRGFTEAVFHLLHFRF